MSERTKICPNCCCELPEEDFLDPEDFDALQSALEDELERMARRPLSEPTAAADVLGEPGEEDLDELLELVVDALLAQGLGETFFDWRGEVTVSPRRELGVTLDGASRPVEHGPKNNGRLVIEASLKPGRKQPVRDRR